MFALGFTRVKFLVNDDPAYAEPSADDPDYIRRCRQFRQLGFQPVGTVDETVWFINPIKWYRQSLLAEPLAGRA